MKKLIIVCCLALLPAMAFASGGGVQLDHVDLDDSDNASLQSGAKIFTNYCMGCHSARFSRYGRVAEDLGIPPDMYMENLVFDDSKIGDLMTIAMSNSHSKQFFGAAPPDLTMVSRVRGPDWLYTYLRTFYRDDSRPWGVNNKTFPNVGMPHVLLEMQGLQECAPGPIAGHVKIDPLTGQVIAEDPCGSLEVTKKGTMTPAEYDQAMYNLVNFLAYTAEPMARDRKRMGVYVLLFITLFGIFAYLLNREYWKDIH
jgi:ubiquinol-cytochrome c reductase cytochrome b subunit